MDSNRHMRWTVALAVGSTLAALTAAQDHEVQATLPPSIPTHIMTEQQVLMAYDGQTSQHFGTTVAVSENIAAVGAPVHIAQGVDSGSVYVFRRNGLEWQESGLLLPRDGAMGDRFGASIALSENAIVVGAPNADGVGTNSGAVYVFHRGPSGWIQYAKLQPQDAGHGDRFGTSVAVHKNTIVIGAPAHRNFTSNYGCAYVYQLNRSQWTQSAVLTASDGGNTTGFGSSVAIGKSWVVVGSRFENIYGIASGATYVFRRDKTEFVQEAQLVPPVGRGHDGFGNSLALSGNELLIGTWGGQLDKGYAAIYHHDGVRWSPFAKLQASDGFQNDGFGYAVTFAGENALIGAQTGLSRTGWTVSAYLFRFSGDHWQETKKLVTSNNASIFFGGFSVSGTDRFILLGGYSSVQGAAYIFDPTDSDAHPMDSDQRAQTIEFDSLPPNRD